MANWSEVERIKNDAVFVRGLASRLLKIEGYSWTGTARAFLEDMAKLSDRRRTDGDLLTTRQGELLLDLRDESDLIEVAGGFSVARLIENCYVARLDLSDDDDVEYIAKLKESGIKSIRRSHLRRLLRCARMLGVIEEYVDVAA